MWAHLSPINKSMKIGRHLSSFLSKRANRKGIYESLIPTLEWPITRVILITKRNLNFFFIFINLGQRGVCVSTMSSPSRGFFFAFPNLLNYETTSTPHLTPFLSFTCGFFFPNSRSSVKIFFFNFFFYPHTSLKALSSPPFSFSTFDERVRHEVLALIYFIYFYKFIYF